MSKGILPKEFSKENSEKSFEFLHKGHPPLYRQKKYNEQ